MDIKDISKTAPIEPEINADGWYCQCLRCWTDVEPRDVVCPKCGQAQDWSWFGKTIKKSKEKDI